MLRMEKKLITGVLQACSRKIQKHLTPLIVKRPRVALTLVILSSVIVLPLITSAALTPFVLLLDLSSFIATKGTIYVIYMVLFQGFVLVILLVILFFIAFTFATIFSLLHSYYSFYK